MALHLDVDEMGPSPAHAVNLIGLGWHGRKIGVEGLDRAPGVQPEIRHPGIGISLEEILGRHVVGFGHRSRLDTGSWFRPTASFHLGSVSIRTQGADDLANFGHVGFLEAAREIVE